MAKMWTEMDWGGRVFYYRLVSGTIWHIIDVLDMDDACGSDNEGRPQWDAAVKEVDISRIDRTAIARSADVPDDACDAQWAVEAVSYGQAAPLWDDSSANRRKLLRDAKRQSKLLASGGYHGADSFERTKAMTRPVNGIGQTAEEFAYGGNEGLAAAINRGLATGDQAAGIFATMYRACDGQTLGAGRFPVELLDDEQPQENTDG